MENTVKTNPTKTQVYNVIILSIRNARNFDYSEQGTKKGMAKEASTRMNFFSRLAHFKDNEGSTAMSADDRPACYTAMADEAFDEEADND